MAQLNDLIVNGSSRFLNIIHGTIENSEKVGGHDTPASGNAGTSQVVLGNDTRLTNSRTPTSHTHGNIQNGGTLQTNDITIASGDKIVVTDSSDSAKIARTSISFDGSTATKCLTQKGTWESFTNTSGTVTQIKVGTTAYNPTSGVVSLPAYPTTLPASDTTSTYSATGTAPVNGTAVASAIGGLDVTGASSIAASKTISAWSETDGKVSISTQDISITKSQVSDFPTSMTPTSHTHGNIQNGGTLQTNDITIANGDKLVVTDSSDSAKVARTSISFDASTATQCLTKKGTWATFGTSNLTLGTSSTTALKGDTKYAGSSSAGGAATSANKINTDGGSMLNPVYFSSGVPVASSGNSIPFIVGTGSTAGTWLGALTGLTEYYDGLLILYKPSVAGASTTTLNINSLGAKTCYINNTTKLTTHYPANQPILLTYSTSQNSGCWMALDNYWSDSNTYDRNRYTGTIKAGTTAIVAGNIIVANGSNLYHHLKDGTAFDIRFPILYANAAIAASGTGNNNYDIIAFTITTTQSITLTAYLPVYIKGTLSGTTFTPDSTTPLTQTVPTSSDSKHYMLLGVAYNSTAVYLTEDHRIFSYKCGAFVEHSDVSVRQTLASGNKNRCLLLSYAINTLTTTDVDEQAYRCNTIYANPSTGGLYATQLNGVDIGSSPKFTDNNNAVTQTATTTSSAYEILFSATADNTTRTEGARKNSNLTFNPSSGILKATNYMSWDGYYSLLNSDGTKHWVHIGNGGSTPGGSLHLYDSDDTARINLTANDGVIKANKMQMTTTTGTNKAEFYVDDESNGRMYLYNSSGTSTIEMTGGDGLINLSGLKSGNDTITVSKMLATAFKSSIAMGSLEAQSTTVPNLVNELRYSNGCCGSVSITTAYVGNPDTVATGWYNFLWIPHRSGGKNGAANGDNTNYGRLLLFGMTVNNEYAIRYSGSSITYCRRFLMANGVNYSTLYSGSLTNGNQTSVANGYGTFTGYLVIGTLTGTDVRSCVYVPKANLTTSAIRYQYADESDYRSFQMWYSSSTLYIKSDAGSNASGAVKYVYGMQ